MKHSRKGIRTLGLLAAPAILALLLLSGVAQGAGPTPDLTLQAPAQGTLGQPATVETTLTSGGSPVAGATIQLYSPASFFSVNGEVFLGEAITDDAGTAVFHYEPRRTENVELIARFAGNAAYGPAERSTAIVVQEAPQVYQEKAGVQVPGVGVWLLVAIIGTVWSTYFLVFVLVSRIALEGTRARVA